MPVFTAQRTTVVDEDGNKLSHAEMAAELTSMSTKLEESKTTESEMKTSKVSSNQKPWRNREILMGAGFGVLFWEIVLLFSVFFGIFGFIEAVVTFVFKTGEVVMFIITFILGIVVWFAIIAGVLFGGWWLAKKVFKKQPESSSAASS